MKFINLKNRKNIRSTIILFSVLFAFITLTSCNMFESIADKDSDEAKYQEAIMLIDDGNYDEALIILNQLPASDEITGLKASCNSGSAGIDLVNLVSLLSDNTDNSDSLEVFGSLVGNDEGKITADEISDKLTDLNTAIDLWEDIPPTSDLYETAKVQLAVLSMTHAVLTITDIVLGDITEISEIELSQDAIEAAYTTYGGELNDTDIDGDNLGYLVDDINRIAACANSDELDLSDDMKSGFDDFLTDVGYDGSNITATQLAAYFNK